MKSYLVSKNSSIWLISISKGDKDLFEETLSNNGSLLASLSFPVGRTYTDVDSAWIAVMGITIDLNGAISSSGFFTAVLCSINIVADIKCPDRTRRYSLGAKS